MQPSDLLTARLMLERHHDFMRAAQDARIARRAARRRPLGLRAAIAASLAGLAHRIDPERHPAPPATFTS